MARPRKDSNIVATEKIEKALWVLLREEKYSNITVQKLADKAGVNRNAIYYHYENIDDVAKNALLHYMQSGVIEQFMHMVMHDLVNDESAVIDENFFQGVRKLQSCINSGSIYLRELLIEEIKRQWFKKLHIEEEKLLKSEAVSIEFAIGGIIAVLGSEEMVENPLLIRELIETDIVKVSFDSLQKVAKEMESR